MSHIGLDNQLKCGTFGVTLSVTLIAKMSHFLTQNRKTQNTLYKTAI